MTDDEGFQTELRTTLETHETAVKRSIESFGELETAFQRTVSEFEDDEEALDELERLGRALESHERRLETLVETLNDYKGVIRNTDDVTQHGLQAAMEKARRRARHESRPPGSEPRDP